MKKVNLTIEKKSYNAREAIRTLRTNLQFCGDDKQVILVTSCIPGEGKSSVAVSLAESIAEMASLTGRTYTSINIVGGGCQDAYLNQMTANACGLPVYAGPIEGTSLGNLVVQMIGDGRFDDLQQARDAIRASFDVEVYQPE